MAKKTPKQVTVGRFRVMRIAVEPNLRGQQDMRRVSLKAIDGAALASQEPLPEGITAPEPDGLMTMLVNAAAAKGFVLGEDVDLILRDRE